MLTPNPDLSLVASFLVKNDTSKESFQMLSVTRFKHTDINFFFERTHTLRIYLPHNQSSSDFAC